MLGWIAHAETSALRVHSVARCRTSTLSRRRSRASPAMLRPRDCAPGTRDRRWIRDAPASHARARCASQPTAAPTGETASTFRRPFTYVLPTDVQVDYGPQTSTFWEFRVPDSGGPGQAAWFLIVQAIDAGRADPCSIESAEVPLADARAAMDYLKTVPTLSVTEESAGELDGRPALSATLTFESPTGACPDLSPWSTDAEALPEPFRDPATAARITLVTVDGETIAITTLATRESIDWFRWADDIIESIHFLP